MASEGRQRLLPIPRGARKYPAAEHLQAAHQPAVVSDTRTPQSACTQKVGGSHSVVRPVDTAPESPAPLSSSSLLRHSSFIRAVCVNALVRICAGGDQRWSSLLRQLDRLCPTSGCLVNHLGRRSIFSGRIHCLHKSRWFELLIGRRSQILEEGRHDAIRLPYAPEARLALVHLEDVARMLLILLDSFSQCSACEPQHGCGSLDCRRLRSRISSQTG